MVSCSHPSILLKHLHHEQGFCHFVNGIYPLKKEEARSHLFASHHIHLQRLASQFDTSEVDYFGRTRSTLEYSTGFLYNTMSYTPIVDDENSALLGEEPVAEVFPVKTVQNQDAAFAMRLAEREASHCRQQEIEANARAWDAHYRYSEYSTDHLKTAFCQTIGVPH